MRILGIDPGIAIVGYSIIEKNNNDYKIVTYGVIETHKDESSDKRLKFIYDSIIYLIEKFSPEEMAIEELFYFKNAKTIISVAQARGVELLAGINSHLKIYEYTPLQIKQAITGYGRADKKQIQDNIKMIFKLKEIPKPDDAADALAIALCHGVSNKFKEQFILK